MVKNLPANAGDNAETMQRHMETWRQCRRDVRLILGFRREPAVRNGNPLQHSCLENTMDRRAWRAIVSPQCHKESDTTEHTHTHTQTQSLSTPEVVSSNITSNLLPSKGLISILTFVEILLLNQSTVCSENQSSALL